MLSKRRKGADSRTEHPLKLIGKHKVQVLTELLRITDGRKRVFIVIACKNRKLYLRMTYRSQKIKLVYCMNLR